VPSINSMVAVNALKDENDSSSEKYSLHRERIAKLQLFGSTLSFAVSFVAQKHAVSQGLGPFAFTACRFIVSTSSLLLFRPVLQYLLHSKVVSDDSESLQVSNATRELFKWGIMCGCVLSAGSNLQQRGLQTVSASKTAFITGMYVIFVPIVEYILPGFQSNLNWRVWLSAAISLTGMYFLSLDSNTTIGAPTITSGDLIVFGSMLCWVAAIIISGTSMKRGCDSISYTIIQFGTATFLNTSIALIFETNSFVYPFHDIMKSWDMILLVGLSKGLSFLFGTLGQMYVRYSFHFILLYSVFDDFRIFQYPLL
jgi:drug/metabolite transporter (DMT)-like permease